MSRELAVIGNTAGPELPALIAGAGERAALRFLEFFTVNIRNQNTRAAYARAAADFPALVRRAGDWRSSGASSRCMWPRISSSCRASARLPRSSNIWPVSACCSTGWSPAR